jgi:hypothetical protein
MLSLMMNSAIVPAVNHLVILSEAKDLCIAASNTHILRYAQDDNSTLSF